QIAISAHRHVLSIPHCFASEGQFRLDVDVTPVGQLVAGDTDRRVIIEQVFRVTLGQADGAGAVVVARPEQGLGVDAVLPGLADLREVFDDEDHARLAPDVALDAVSGRYHRHLPFRGSGPGRGRPHAPGHTPSPRTR